MIFEIFDIDIINKLKLYINDINIILKYGINIYEKQIELINNNYFENISTELNKEFNNKFKLKDDEINNLKNQIDNLKLNHGVDISILIQNSIKDKQIIIDHQNLQLNELKNKIKDLENDLKIVNKDMNDKLLLSYQSKNEENKILYEVKDTINTYVHKIMNTNTYKGLQGELFILEYLKDKFYNAKIDDVSANKESGDIYFELNNLKLLIESKNVKYLKNDDIKKFYRDIDLNNNINAALLISLNNSNLVDNKRTFHFEIKNNIFIIMISDVYNSPDYIRFAILLLEELINNNLLSNNDINSNAILTNSINQIYDIYNNEYILLQSEKQISNKLIDIIKKKEDNLLNLNNIFKNLPNIIHNNDFQSIINKINNELNINNNFKITIKNLEKIGISHYTCNKYGGIKKLNDIFNNINI